MWSETERRYKEELRSREWDVGDGSAPRFQYAILSLPRTGSEFLCAALRRRGLGVPIEYVMAGSLAERWGCADGAGKIDVRTYFVHLHAKRTTPNGIFGLKLQPLHLRALSGDDTRRAASILGGFGRTIVLRRKDRLLQAISLARALLTGQFHIVPGDTARPLNETDDVLFHEIAAQLARVLADERYVADVLSLVEPGKIATMWYEDLSDAAVDAIGAELLSLAKAEPATVVHADHDLPRPGDREEALAIKLRFLAYVGQQENYRGPQL
jgi:LPS sulfotransferase NodH